MQRLIKNVPNQLLSKSLRRHRHFRNWSTSTSSANSSGDSKNEEDKNVSIYSALMEFPKEADVVIIGKKKSGNCFMFCAIIKQTAATKWLPFCQKALRS